MRVGRLALHWSGMMIDDTRTRDAIERSTLPSDERVFDALARARDQYEEYLRIAAESSLIRVCTEEPVLPPPADLPLSLTIWPDR